MMPDHAVADSYGRPLRSLRISVTDRCNLRCSYCMPEESYRWLPKRELLDYAELARLVDRFADAGVTRVRLTGGEPLLRRDLDVLVRMLVDKPAIMEVALTTNGVELGRQAGQLAGAGLHRLTVSLDTLRRDRFERLTRTDALADVLAGIEAARGAGFSGTTGQGDARLKLDCVVIRGVNDDELLDMLDFAARCDAEVRFIEYMDVGGATQWTEAGVFSRAEIVGRIAISLGRPAPIGARGASPAERFVLPDGRAFGVIASTTMPFCSACDRSRLTADGMWLHCLYAARGIDLKSPLRAGADDESLRRMIGSSWSRRRDRGAEERAALPHRGALIPREALRRDPHLEMHTRGG